MSRDIYPIREAELPAADDAGANAAKMWQEVAEDRKRSQDMAWATNAGLREQLREMTAARDLCKQQATEAGVEIVRLRGTLDDVLALSSQGVTVEEGELTGLALLGQISRIVEEALDG